MHTKNTLTTNRKPMQGCAMKMMKNKKIKKKRLPIIFFVIKNAKFDKPLQRPIGTDQDETSSIKASYNKGIHTVVIIQLDNLWASAGVDAEGAP